VQPFNVGVTVIDAVIGVVPAFIAINPVIFPVPLLPKPIAVFEFVQANVAPCGVLEKEVVGIEPLLHMTMLAGRITIGTGLIVIVFVYKTAAQPPAAAILLLIVNVPGLLADRSTCPVEVLIKTSPVGMAVNTPALAPDAKFGNGSIPFEQYGPE
jgi:hypothetical protein